jgi:hypothetical protein
VVLWSRQFSGSEEAVEVKESAAGKAEEGVEKPSVEGF